VKVKYILFYCERKMILQKDFIKGEEEEREEEDSEERNKKFFSFLFFFVK